MPKMLENATNEVVLDAIRYDASPDYQRRISEAAKVGLERVLAQLGEYRPLWNEFEQALVNKIGTTIAQVKSWSNPLQEFKTGKLEYGDTVEEIQVGLLKAHGWEPKVDYGEAMLFSRELPEVQTNYHRLNRQDMYKISVNERILKRAFLQANGLGSFVSQLLDAPLKSDNWDEFLLMSRLFNEYEKQDGFYRVNIPDITKDTSTAEDARLVLRKLRSLGSTMEFISTKYNAAHMPTHASADEMVLFCTPEFKAAIDVNALAAAFNIQSADIPNRVFTLPDEYFNVDGLQAILTSRDFFRVFDTMIESGSMYNPASLMTNHFFHHHQIISASRFVPAVMFTTKPGTEVVEVTSKLTGISALKVYDNKGVEVQNIAPGLLYQVVPSIVTKPADSADWWRHGVRLSLIGAQSARSYISDSGVLSLSPYETAKSVKVTAWSVEDNDISLEIVIPVVGENLPVWPDNTPPAAPTP